MANPVQLESSKREALKSELRDNLDASPVNRVLSDPEVTLDDIQSLSSDEKKKLRQAIQANKAKIGDETATQLEVLLVEAEKTSVTSPKTTESKGSSRVEAPSVNAPAEITAAGAKALDAVKNALEPSGKPPAEYLSAWRQLKSVIPGMEVGGLSEIGDVLNQSRQYSKDMINYLVQEASSPSLELSFNSWELSKNRPGWHFNFMPDKFSSIEEKHAAIKNALNNIENLWKNQGPDASGMGVWGWAVGVVAFYFGYKVIWKGGKFVASKIKWFGVGSAVVAGMEAVGGVAAERAQQVKGTMNSITEQRNATLKARGIIDPASSDFKELFDVAERTIRGDSTISDVEKARRIRALNALQGNYIADYNAGKIRSKYVGNNIRAEVGYTVNGNFGVGNIDARAGQGVLSTARTATTEAAKNTARNIPGVGRFFQGGLPEALNIADNLKTGASLDPLVILGESVEFKDADTRNNLETIWELSKQRAKLLRIQEKMIEIENQKILVSELKHQLDGIPKTIDLQTETQINTLQSSRNMVNQQPATQIMKRQEVNPEYTKVLDEYNKVRNAGLDLERKLATVNPNKISQQSLIQEIEARNVAIEGKITDLRTAYPNAQVPEYDRNNRGVNFEKWMLRLSKIFKK